MEFERGFIMQKNVDWSMLNDGFTIPVSVYSLIIVSPNYHRIMHKNNPIFDRKNFRFKFPNGEILKLKLYDHLMAK